jgi:hypothetical protein
MSGADNTRWKAPPTTRDAMDMSASTCCQHCALIGVRHSAPGKAGDQAGPQVSLLLADQELSRAIKEAQSQQIQRSLMVLLLEQMNDFTFAELELL